MQPYFFPYIGYFQLIAAVDVFILYDNIKYTKKGWVNRNCILQNGKRVVFSLPLKKDSDYMDVCARELASGFNRDKLLNQIRGAYKHAPYFSQTLPVVEQIIQYQENNLFNFLHHSIVKTCEHLGIVTAIKISSNITIDHDLKGQDRVLALCNAVAANTYVNAIGGLRLYSKETFWERGIDLKFIQSISTAYPQIGDQFVPLLSIIDTLMAVGCIDIKHHLDAFNLISSQNNAIDVVAEDINA